MSRCERRVTAPDLMANEPAERLCYVYVMANRPNGDVAVSLAQNLAARVQAQKQDRHPLDFTSVNEMHTLVRVEEFADICAAMARYEYLRGLGQRDVANLVNADNPAWRDLSDQVVQMPLRS